MRKDIEELFIHINITETQNNFGVINNNDSKVIINCCVCKFRLETKVFNLKIRIRKSGKVLCNSCLAKQAWNNGKRAKIAAHWDEKTRLIHSESMKKVWSDQTLCDKQSEISKKNNSNPETKRKISDNSKKLWKDQNFRENQISKKKKLWQNPDYIEKQRTSKTEEHLKLQSDKQRQAWEKPGYKELQSDKQRQAWEKPGYRESQAEKQRQAWEKPGYRESQAEKQRQAWEKPGYREHLQQIWQSEEFKNKLSNLIKEKFKNEEFRLKSSEAAKRRWKNSGYRKKIVEAIKNTWKNDEYRNHKIQQNKEMWSNEEFREKCAKIRALQSGKKSPIEIITENILNGLNVDFVWQKPLGPYVYDFFLPNFDVYIECQGEYWHSIPGRKERDAAKLSYLEKAASNSKILYLYEHEFLNPNIVINKVSSLLFNTSTVIEVADFEFTSLRIETMRNDELLNFFKSHHYASFGRSGKILFGVYLGDTLIAACKFSSVIRNEVASSIGLDHKNVLELDRFCIHPRYHKKNFASWLLSKVTKIVFNKFPKISCLISFADTTYGHNGTIYKASNWTVVGRVRPDYYYVNEDGFILHKKTLYNRATRMSKTEREYSKMFGYQKQYGREKIKFSLLRK